MAGLGPAPEPGDRQRQALERALAHKVLADQDDPEGKDPVRSAVDLETRQEKHGDYDEGHQLNRLVDADGEAAGGCGFNTCCWASSTA